MSHRRHLSVHIGLPLVSLLALLSAPLTLTGCADDDEEPMGRAGSSGAAHAGSSGAAHAGSSGAAHAGTSGAAHAGASGAAHAGASGAGESGGGAAGSTGAEAGAAGGPEEVQGGAGGKAGNAGGEAGAAIMGGSPGGAGEGGEGGSVPETVVCDPGYADTGAGECETACAPRDFDDANIVLTQGTHADLISAGYTPGPDGLRLFVVDDSGGLVASGGVVHHVHRSPERVLVHGPAAAQAVVPDIPAFANLFEAGSTVWVFPEGQPEAQEKALVWPGFQAYELPYGAMQDDRVVVHLLEHEGAGKFVGFASPQDPFTPAPILFIPTAGIGEHWLEAGVHQHMNWTFTQAGLHRLRFELQGKLVSGANIDSAPHIYRFFLGDLADLPATEPTVLALGGIEPSYTVGAGLNLTAKRYGMSSSLPVAWSRRCLVNEELGAWEPVGTGETLTSTVAQAQCQFVACLMDGSNVSAISQPIQPNLE